MKASHITVAAEQGMSAGLRAYEQQLSTSGLPTVLAKAVEVLSMPRKARFDWYCAQFGADVTAAKGLGVEDDAQTEIERLRARIAELSGQTTPAPTPTRERKPAKAASKPRKVKTNLWRMWAVRKHNIPTTVGATFEYRSKKRNTTYTHRVVEVTSEGVITTRA